MAINLRDAIPRLLTLLTFLRIRKKGLRNFIAVVYLQQSWNCSVQLRIESAGEKFKIGPMSPLEIEKPGVFMESVKKIPDFPFRLH